MPSSISSSETPDILSRQRARYTRAAGITILLGALLIAGLETVTRLGFRHISRIEGRTAREYQEAAHTHHGVLMLGNSLLLEGMDYERMRKTIDVHRFVIEGTAWYDWYFGIRRLLAQGSRPDLIILCMNPVQLVSDETAGDYSAFYLFRFSDIPAVSRAMHATLTRMSSLAFAHYSLFYAGRSNIRNIILNRTDPAYAGFLHDLQTAPRQFPSLESIRGPAEERLRALGETCKQYQIPCEFLIPPARNPQGEAEVIQAAHRAGMSVVRPIAGGVLGDDMFSDGFHLNGRGAAIFTDALERELASSARAY